MSVPLPAFPDIISALIMVGNLQVNIFSPLLIEIVVAFSRKGGRFTFVTSYLSLVQNVS